MLGDLEESFGWFNASVVIGIQEGPVDMERLRVCGEKGANRSSQDIFNGTWWKRTHKGDESEKPSARMLESLTEDGPHSSRIDSSLKFFLKQIHLFLIKAT